MTKKKQIIIAFLIAGYFPVRIIIHFLFNV
jgi:hypothetical protein